jgi:hypothetical protein
VAFWTLTAMVVVLYTLALASLRESSAGPGVRRAAGGPWQEPAPPTPQAPRSLRVGSLYLFSDQAEGSEPAV